MYFLKSLHVPSSVVQEAPTLYSSQFLTTYGDSTATPVEYAGRHISAIYHEALPPTSVANLDQNADMTVRYTVLFKFLAYLNYRYVALESSTA